MLSLSSLIVCLLGAFHLLDTHKYSANKGTGKKGRGFYSSDGGLRIKKVWHCKVVANEIGKSRNKAEETKHVWSGNFHFWPSENVSSRPEMVKRSPARENKEMKVSQVGTSFLGFKKLKLKKKICVAPSCTLHLCPSGCRLLQLSDFIWVVALHSGCGWHSITTRQHIKNKMGHPTLQSSGVMIEEEQIICKSQREVWDETASVFWCHRISVLRNSQELLFIAQDLHEIKPVDVFVWCKQEFTNPHL